MNKKESFEIRPNMVVGFISAIVSLASLFLPFFAVTVVGSRLSMSIIQGIREYGMDSTDQVLFFLFGLGLICIIVGICLNSRGGAITGGSFVIIVWCIYLYLTQSGNTDYGMLTQYGIGFYAMLLGGLGGIAAGLITKSSD